MTQIIEAVPAVVAPVSAWTPAMIGAVVGAIATLVTTLGGVAVLIIREIRAAKNEGQLAGDARDAKLGRIEVLVDGRYSEVLKRLAAVQAQLATATGNKVDAAEAVIAQSHSDEQEARLGEANTKKP
jgi:hypothetical protein